jgi:hypothetical protein
MGCISPLLIKTSITRRATSQLFLTSNSHIKNICNTIVGVYLRYHPNHLRPSFHISYLSIMGPKHSVPFSSPSHGLLALKHYESLKLNSWASSLICLIQIFPTSHKRTSMIYYAKVTSLASQPLVSRKIWRNDEVDRPYYVKCHPI